MASAIVPCPHAVEKPALWKNSDAEVALLVRLGDEAAVHVGVPARLVDEERAHVVEVLLRVAALLEDGRARDRSIPPVTIRNGSPAVW